MRRRITLAQRRALRRAHRQCQRRAVILEGDTPEGVLLLFPPQPDQLDGLVAPVNRWLARRNPGPLKILIHQGSSYLADRIEQRVKVIDFQDIDLKKNGLPGPALLKQIDELYLDTLVLLNPGYDPLTETVFVAVPARLKVAFWRPFRQEYASLLIRTREEHSLAKKTALILDYLASFDSGEDNL